MASEVVFDIPGKITAREETSAARGCSGIHSGTAWTDGEPLENGSYYLEGPVKLSKEIDITGNVTLCLNGQTITAATGSRIFTVNSGGSLTICDCTEGGKITGGDNSSGGAVYVNSGATFTLSGGTISGNSAKQGGGVYNAGKFIMTGGVIFENNSEEGAGVYLHEKNAKFEMSGGTILQEHGNS